jgi:hypothetical protein
MAEAPPAVNDGAPPQPTTRHKREQPGPLPPPTALRGREDTPERATEEVLEALAQDRGVTPSEAENATAWFLDEEPDEEEDQTHTIELNVGVGDETRWISWVVRPVDSDDLRRINRQTLALRRRGRQDDLAIDQLGNLKVIVAGSVDPDIETIAQQKGKQAEALVLQRFKKKPGLITQLATQIMALSGFDDEDVRDALSAKN